MLKFLSPTWTTPPSGWTYTDPDTGFVFQKPYKLFSDLIDHIECYRKANNLEALLQIEALVEDFLCRLPENAGLSVERERVDRSVGGYVSGARAAAKTIAKAAAHKIGLSEEDGFVTRTEAERRAKICEGCPKNVFDSEDSLARVYSNGFARGLIGNRRVSNANLLKTCSVCSCPLAVKVWYERDVVEPEITEEQRAEFPQEMPSKSGGTFTCWQLFKDEVDG